MSRMPCKNFGVGGLGDSVGDFTVRQFEFEYDFGGAL